MFLLNKNLFYRVVCPCTAAKRFHRPLGAWNNNGQLLWFFIFIVLIADIANLIIVGVFQEHFSLCLKLLLNLFLVDLLLQIGLRDQVFQASWVRLIGCLSAHSLTRIILQRVLLEPSNSFTVQSLLMQLMLRAIAGSSWVKLEAAALLLLWCSAISFQLLLIERVVEIHLLFFICPE